MSYNHCCFFCLQKELNVPKCILDVWDGPKRFKIGKALHEAGITPQQFYFHWQEKLESIKTMDDKKQLVHLLDNAGIRHDGRGDKQKRLRRKIWFIQKIIGMDVQEPEVTTVYSNSQKEVCIAAFVYAYIKY